MHTSNTHVAVRSFRPSRWVDDAPYKYVKPNDRYRVGIYTCAL